MRIVRKRKKIQKKSGSKKDVLTLPLTSPYNEHQPICLLRKSPNMSRKSSGSVVGATGSAKTQIWPYYSLYFLPESIIALNVCSLKLITEI